MYLWGRDEQKEWKVPQTLDNGIGNCSNWQYWLWKWGEPDSRISAPICFPVFFYPFLDRFFHLQHADFNGEHLSHLNKTIWPEGEQRKGKKQKGRNEEKERGKKKGRKRKGEKTKKMGEKRNREERSEVRENKIKEERRRQKKKEYKNRKI